MKLLVNLMIASALVQTPEDGGIRHVFPQFADGVVPASSQSYTSTLTVSALDFNSATTCVFRLLGVPPTSMTDVRGAKVVNTSFNFTLGASGWQIIRSAGTQPLVTGSAMLECSRPVSAQMRYTLTSGTSVESEAAVFSASPGRLLQILADYRDGSRMAFALANPFTFHASHSITVVDIDGRIIGQTIVQIAPSSAVARFVDEFVPLPAGHVGQVLIQANVPGVDAYAMGLRYTGEVFSSVPATVRIR